MHYGMIKDFVESELKELETRDADTLYECIAENLVDMGVEFQGPDLWDAIQHCLKNEVKQA